MNSTTPLKRRAINSLVGAYSIQFAITGVNLLSKVVLARLIAPDQWGLFAEALLVISVVSTLRDMGLRSHLLRESERPYGNVLVLHVFTSLILFAFVEVLAPLFAFFSPQIPSILRLLAPVLVFTGLSGTANIYVDRELIVQKSVIPQLASLGVNVGLSVALAWQGWQIRSLIWANLVSSAIYTLMIWRPVLSEVNLELTLKHTLKLLSGSKYLFFLDILGLITAQVDIGIVGGLLSPLEAGYYSMVYALLLKPTRIVETAMARVILPVFAELAGDRQRLSRLYHDATVLVYSIEVPLYAFAFTYPELVVNWLLGEQWVAVVPFVRIMAFYGIVSPFGTFGWEIIKVVKEDRFFTLMSVGSALILTLGGIALTRNFGIYGMIMATYCVQILTPFLLWMLARLFGPELKRLVLHLAWVYVVSFSVLWFSKAVSCGLQGLIGLVGTGVCWLILIFPYRSRLVSFAREWKKEG